MSEKSLNTALHRYHYILNQSYDISDRRLIDIFFILLSNHIQLGKLSDLDINFLYIYLNKALFKLANNDKNDLKRLFFKNNEIQVLLQNIIQFRDAINDDYLIFQILESLLVLYKKANIQNDDVFFFQVISLIIVKVVFKDFEKDVLPLSSSITFLSNILINSKQEVLSGSKLHKIAPGIITKLIKVLNKNFKHDTNYFKVVLALLTQIISKCKEQFSKNENVLIYQSLDVMINKNWSMNYKGGNTKIDTIILQDFIIPLKDFELVSDLLIIEYLFRYQSYSEELQQLEVFDHSSITNILCGKIKMINVLYFDLKTLKIFKNGLMKLTTVVDDQDKILFYKQFNSFVECGYTKPHKQTTLNKVDVQLPSHIGENTIQNKELAVKFMVNEAVHSFDQIDSQLLDTVLNNEIKAKWLDLADVWKNFFSQKEILEVMEEYGTNDEEIGEKRVYLFYYIFFQKLGSKEVAQEENPQVDDIITNLDSINIDDFLTFSDDDETSPQELLAEPTPIETDDTLLNECLNLLNISPTQSLPLSISYFLCGYILSPFSSLSDLKDLEPELLPLLLSNIDNPISQLSLQSLSCKLYSHQSPALSFQKMIRENTDVILSHVSTMISLSNMTTQGRWIVFTKNVFQVCGIEVVSKADDVFNLMFDLLAVQSIQMGSGGEEILRVLELFGVVLDLIIQEYQNLISEESGVEVKKTSLEDVKEMFKDHGLMYDSDDEEEIEEVNAVVPATEQEVALADEPAYSGKIPEHVYKLVVELLGYTERIYPLVKDSIAKPYAVLLSNIKKISLILNTSPKNYLPQLAQVIYPFIEKIVKSGIFDTLNNPFVAHNKHELIVNSGIQSYGSDNINKVLIKHTLEILTLIVKQQAAFMFTRVSTLYFDYLYDRLKNLEGFEKAVDEFKCELNKFVLTEGGLVVRDRDIIKLRMN